MIAHFHQHVSGEGQVYFCSRTKANHSKALALSDLIANIGPGDDPSRNGASELPDNERGPWIFERPGHRFIFLGAFRAARVETKPFTPLAKNNPPINRRAIGVDIEDGQENSDATRFCFQNIHLFDFGNVSNDSVSSRNDRARISGNTSFRIAEKEKCIKD